jgi:polyhydroxybutyrate depolymerase
MQTALFTVVALLAAQPPADTLGPGDHTRQLKMGELKRPYRIHVPESYDPKKPMPVVVVLHGAMMQAQVMEWFCGLSKTADESGFIAVYPTGTGLLPTWNAGVFPGKLNGERADDVKFIGKVLDDLATVLTIDRKRVYAAGVSNGAMMAYRLAVEMPERIAAIAAVGGVMCLEKPEPKTPVPILHFHGTKDGLVPFGGTKNGGGPYPFPSVDECLEPWLKINECSDKPKVTELPAKEDKLRVLRKDYRTGKEKAPVILYVIEGGGHTWPGMDRHAAFLGATTHNISANELMWEFFRQFALR